MTQTPFQMIQELDNTAMRIGKHLVIEPVGFSKHGDLFLVRFASFGDDGGVKLIYNVNDAVVEQKVCPEHYGTARRQGGYVVLNNGGEDMHVLIAG